MTQQLAFDLATTKRKRSDVTSGKRQAEYRKRHPDRERARQRSKRLRSKNGRVVNVPCSRLDDGNCKGRVEGHHHNGYEAWDDTIPLCDYHHTLAEMEAKKAASQ